MNNVGNNLCKSRDGDNVNTIEKSRLILTHYIAFPVFGVVFIMYPNILFSLGRAEPKEEFPFQIFFFKD